MAFCCEAAQYSFSIDLEWILYVCMSVFDNFCTILRSWLNGQTNWKINFCGLNSLLFFATNKKFLHIPALLVLIALKPIYQFLMHHNLMNVNSGGTRERDVCNQYNVQYWPAIVIASNSSLKLAVIYSIYKTISFHIFWQSKDQKVNIPNNHTCHTVPWCKTTALCTSPSCLHISPTRQWKQNFINLILLIAKR